MNLNKYVFFTLLLLNISAVSPSAASAAPVDEIEILKENVQQLTVSVQELEQDTLAIKSKNLELSKDLRRIKGLPPSESDVAFKSLTARADRLNNMKGTIKISGSITAIVQASENHKITSGQTTNDRTIGAGAFDLYLESQITENTLFFANLEANSINQVFTPILSFPNGNSTFSTHLGPQNIDVMNILEIYVESIWYENKLTTTIGKLDLTNYFDGSLIAWDEHTQFLSGIFLDNPVFSSVVPLNTIGARIHYEMGRGFVFQAALASDDNSGDKLFNQLFGIIELDYKTHFFFGKEGNYRAYGYVENIASVDQMNNATGGSTNALGGGISVDQGLTDKLTAFLRWGANESTLADSPSNSFVQQPAVNSSLSLGAQYKGLLPNRPDDVFGGAWGFINPSDPFGTIPRRPDNEYFMEFYYNYKLRDNVRISPVLQFAEHPNGDSGENWITIFGGRAFLEF